MGGEFVEQRFEQLTAAFCARNFADELKRDVLGEIGFGIEVTDAADLSVGRPRFYCVNRKSRSNALRMRSRCLNPISASCAFSSPSSRARLTSDA